MTYYLNRLQRLEEPEHYCVTLNRSAEIREDHVIERIVYDHPRYTLAGLAAQQELPSLSEPAAHRFLRRLPRLRLPRGRARVGRCGGRTLGVRW